MQNNDLISRSALLEAMPKNDEIFSFEARRVICNAPAVDAEVVRHGRWNPVMHRDIFGKEYVYRHACSKCNEYALCDRANYDSEEVLSEYCPNCGAKMDAEVEGC